MSAKYKLFSSIDEWEACHDEIKAHLGISADGATVQYTDRIQIDNPEHPDFGKYVFIVKTSGMWKCDDQFNASDLVDGGDWLLPTPFPPEE